MGKKAPSCLSLAAFTSIHENAVTNEHVSKTLLHCLRYMFHLNIFFLTLLGYS